MQTLDDYLAETERPLDAVISLLADTDEVVARLLRRAEIDGRSDDNEETIRVRLQVYAEQTEPLLEVYRSRGLLVEVDGLGEIDEVSERVFAALDARERAELVESEPMMPRAASGSPGSGSRPRGSPAQRLRPR